ncbi:MAG: hypothetical protein EOO77_44745 [Oxalobacteraceae bacterium]|nr:MAG: hypothetical protein EOO77_44745 [Oxalobacteraceae bacterium]
MKNWGHVTANISQTTAAVTTNVSPAGENTLQKRVEGFRAKIAIEASHSVQPQFLSDTLANSGQTYAGLVDVLHLYDISQSGNKWFYDAIVASDWADKVPAGPYDNDSMHLTAEGAMLMATGGDTPQYGYGSIL